MRRCRLFAVQRFGDRVCHTNREAQARINRHTDLASDRVRIGSWTIRIRSSGPKRDQHPEHGYVLVIGREDRFPRIRLSSMFRPVWFAFSTGTCGREGTAAKATGTDSRTVQASPWLPLVPGNLCKSGVIPDNNPEPDTEIQSTKKTRVFLGKTRVFWGVWKGVAEGSRTPDL
jgi:hypothetical protein